MLISVLTLWKPIVVLDSMLKSFFQMTIIWNIQMPTKEKRAAISVGEPNKVQMINAIEAKIVVQMRISSIVIFGDKFGVWELILGL